MRRSSHRSQNSETGRPKELAVDILRTAVARVGVNVELVPVPFEQIQRTLADGRAQAIFPLTITPERLSLFDFSAPILITGGALFVRAPNATPENLAALSGKIVVTPRTGPLAAFIQKNAPSVKLVIAMDYEESLARLVKGEADAAALGFHVGIRIAARLYPSQVTEPRRCSRSCRSQLPCQRAVKRSSWPGSMSDLPRSAPTALGNGLTIAGWRTSAQLAAAGRMGAQRPRA